MVWNAEQNIQLWPAEGTSGESSICVPTSAGSFIGNKTMTMSYQRKCIRCDKYFYPSRPDNLYCTKKCQQKAQKDKMRKIREQSLKDGSGGLFLKMRFTVFVRDEFSCKYCGRRPPEVVLQVEHVIPKSKGGGFALSNLVAACEDCNLGKGDVLLEKRLINKILG